MVASSAPVEQYNYDIVRKFTIMALVWGVLAMTAGVYIALELRWAFLNINIPKITIVGLRLISTTLVIFGFVWIPLFATY